MQYRKLGSSDLNVSVIGLGTLAFGGKKVTDPAVSARVIHQALDSGINFIDTASAYGDGESEEHIGQALQGRRDEAIIATKFKLSDHMMGDERHGESVRNRIVASVETSLRKLRTDHVELLQIHHPEPEIPHEEILEPLAELVRDGKVRYIGECNYSSWRHAQSNAVSERNGWPVMVSCQAYYNVLRRHVELELLPFCTANDVAFLPYRPLASGWLSGRYKVGDSTAGKGPRLKAFQQDQHARAVLDSLTEFAAARGHSALDLAFAWMLAHPAVPSVIAGATTPEQILLNVAAGDWQLTMAERDEVDAMAAWDGTDEEVEEPGRHTIQVTRR